MCGISGYIATEAGSDIEILKKMIHAQHHRGPDDVGVEHYAVNEKVVGFAQSRLSILDLSEAGHQPMKYKHLHIVFNGEMYNFKEVRSELVELGHAFSSNSDTEVILHAFEEWGVDFVHRFIGMFALAIFDEHDRKVYFFRDRVGVKPLYYYRHNGLFLFASELKSFHRHPGFKKEIDTNGVRLFFDYGYITAPHTIFQNCYKLEPGKYLVYHVDTFQSDIHTYWDVNQFYTKPKLDIGYHEAKDELHKLLKSAFNYRMIADVPVGVFLSGGYDSTAVTAIIQAESNLPLRTFTIGFEEGNNEAPFAKETAKHLGTSHKEYYFTTKEAQDIIPELPFFYDEPFFDSSALPTIMVSRFAKKDVTVALSADGGDEIFAGYSRYAITAKRLNQMDSWPPLAKRGLAGLLDLSLHFIPENSISLRHKLFGLSGSLKANGLEQGANLYRFSHRLPEFYRNKLFKQPLSEVSDGFSYSGIPYANVIEQMMATDFKNYLPDDIMTKVDRATMSVSLEGREPFLDQRIIEFVAQLPTEFRYDGKVQKKILKDIVYEYVPKEMLERPKTGFSIPIYSWLRGDLSFLVEEYLSENALRKSGIFDVGNVSGVVKQFKENKLHHVTLIWKLLMFQMWFAKWG